MFSDILLNCSTFCINRNCQEIFEKKNMCMNGNVSKVLRNVTRAMLLILINNMHLYLTININLIHFYTESKCKFIHVIRMFPSRKPYLELQ